MRLAIRHSTTYRYSEPATYSVQSLRLSPPSFDSQTVEAWTIRAPGIDRAAIFRDGFGNRVHLVTHTERHESVTIEIEGVVETRDTAGVVSGLPEVAPVALFRRTTRLTQADETIRALAEEMKGGDEVARLHDLMSRIRERIEYRTGETHTGTTAAEALARGAGVCQDHTHVFIAAARHLGFPARYVSGYLQAGAGEASQEAQHAWAEVRIPDLGWAGFDAANGISPDPHYVRVACGLDYEYAAPVRGSRRGGGGEDLDVSVEVGEAAAPQQQ